MLHGNPTWSFYYRNLIGLLSRRCRVIAPDHMGCGLSDKPRRYPYRLATHIDNVQRLLESLRIERFSLVMHDWGGAIGMGVAVRRPGDVKALVAMNTAAFRSTRLPARIRLCRWPVVGDLLVRGVNVFVRGALRMAVGRKMSSDAVRGYLAPYDSWAHRIGVSRFIRDIPLGPEHPSWDDLVAIEEGLARFAATPLLLVWGGRDFCFTPRFFREWQQRFPGAESLFLPEAGHYVLEDGFAEAGPAIDEFLQRVTG
jgi:haloalkane dehalogenase